MKDEFKQMTLEDMANLLPVPTGVTIMLRSYVRSDDDVPIEDCDYVQVDSEIVVNILERDFIAAFVAKAITEAERIYGKQFRQMTQSEVEYAKQNEEYEDEDE